MREDRRVDLPRFEHGARIRPVALVNHVQVRAAGERSSTPCPRPGPYAGVVASGVGERLVLAWRSGTDLLEAVYADGRAVLRVTSGGHTTVHRSRRFSTLHAPAADVALTLTGTQLTVFTRDADSPWEARARVDLRERVDVRDETWLAGLTVEHDGALETLTAGPYGQLGLRDLRLASHPDGTAYRLADGRAVLAATSAGPGFFGTAHTSVWALDPVALELEHLSDLYFRRPDRLGVFGDHATHLVRDGEGWLVATSTWGDFDADAKDATVAVALARTGVDALSGEHVLDTEPLDLPTTGFASVGVWDPHLVHREDGWLVGYVSARSFFRFHPVVAAGPSLEALTVRGADPRRRATEGTTLYRVVSRRPSERQRERGTSSGAGRERRSKARSARLVAGAPRTSTTEEWVVLASDGRDGRRGQRARYPIFDLAMNEIGTIDAPYPTNLPWPTLLPVSPGSRDLLMVGFDGRPWGGSLLGYGTHGAVVIARSVSD